MPFSFNPFTGNFDWHEPGAHTQGTDTILDEGGANEIAVTELVRKATGNIQYYVATDGNDTTGDGTTETPFATLQHAIDLLPKVLNGYYALVWLKDGTYNEGGITIEGFRGGDLYVLSDSYDADLVTIQGGVGDYRVFNLNNNSVYLAILNVSVRINRNDSSCVYINKCVGYVEVSSTKLGDSGNTGTYGILANGSQVSVETVTDIDANKVSIGISSNYSSLVGLYNTATLGDTFSSVTYGGVITDGIVLNKTDYDSAVSLKHAQGSDTALGAVGTKNPPVDADLIVLRDSTSAFALFTSTLTQFLAYLKTYFDTLYNKYVHPDHSGEVTSAADGAQTIANDAVTYAKIQNVSATDKILGRSTAGAGDTEEITCTAFARSILDDADEATFKATVNLEPGVDVQAYDVDITLFRRHTLEAGETLTIADAEQKIVHDRFIINGSGSLVINGSGSLCVIGA